nr:type II toxin-antitoxin system Phd/YefM family antitoxin [uncultured Enterobacter sp.]
MRSFTTTEARQNIAAVMDAAAQGEAVEITRRDGTANILISKAEYERYLAARLDNEFDLIMQRHGRTVKALSDR